jgi:hypothetical protein
MYSKRFPKPTPTRLCSLQLSICSCRSPTSLSGWTGMETTWLSPSTSTRSLKLRAGSGIASWQCHCQWQLVVWHVTDHCGVAFRWVLKSSLQLRQSGRESHWLRPVLKYTKEWRSSIYWKGQEVSNVNEWHENGVYLFNTPRLKTILTPSNRHSAIFFRFLRVLYWLRCRFRIWLDWDRYEVPSKSVEQK